MPGNSRSSWASSDSSFSTQRIEGAISLTSRLPFVFAVVEDMESGRVWSVLNTLTIKRIKLYLYVNILSIKL